MFAPTQEAPSLPVSAFLPGPLAREQPIPRSDTAANLGRLLMWGQHSVIRK